MKKLIIIAIILLVAGAAAFADTSDFYVKTLPIARVYDNNLGYKVVYMKSNFDLASLYIPKEWFAAAAESKEAPKAELVSGKDLAYPYFSIFWKDGKFDHIRLYLQNDLNDPSWGDLDPSQDLTEKFNVETLKLEL